MGVDIQEKSCVSEGKNIFGKLYIPNTKAKTYPTVILSHGFNSIDDDMADIALTFGLTPKSQTFQRSSLKEPPRKKVCKNSANCGIIKILQLAEILWQEEKENQ